ncbi:hypothetical protein BT96DRAFT_925063 [Gymnopus androsaceus JB14]|uniref:Uncharacterized protein n=1 Tax=Gymnopus androsaceus JB14 TaxID=1447944 RepID=A0A6A4H2B5_9AGAR|nr:hypothetical protein BT96DRAFT_925063 [Gymnopus androsaceus JB14]
MHSGTRDLNGLQDERDPTKRYGGYLPQQARLLKDRWAELLLLTLPRMNPTQILLSQTVQEFRSGAG